MKRKFALLAVLGSLLAIAVPTAAMATIKVTPAGDTFEMSGNGVPIISGPLSGSSETCSLTKLVGTIPTAPNNEGLESVSLPISTHTGSCSPGMSMTLSDPEGKTWSILAIERYQALLKSPAGAITLRYTSLPGCKLTSAAWSLAGTFSNGSTSPTLARSAYNAYSGNSNPDQGTWANDGATCALAGQKGTVTFRGHNAPISDTTAPTSVMQITGNI